MVECEHNLIAKHLIQFGVSEMQFYACTNCGAVFEPPKQVQPKCDRPNIVGQISGEWKEPSL